MTNPYKIETPELIVKAQNVLDKITATPYQKKVLEAVIHRLLWHHGDVESTNQWAHEAFDENKRLIQLLRDRWEAGWKGDKEEKTVFDSITIPTFEWLALQGKVLKIKVGVDEGNGLKTTSVFGQDEETGIQYLLRIATEKVTP